MSRARLCAGAALALALLALLLLLSDTASAACRYPQTSRLKELRPGQSDSASYFTLTKGKAVIEVDLTDIPDRCKSSGISFRVVSDQTNRRVSCGGTDSVLGPAHYLRCNVSVLGGTYNVRVANPTRCTVKYRTICSNN